MDAVQGGVVAGLNNIDKQQLELLNQVVNAATELGKNDAAADIVNPDGKVGSNDDKEMGAIRWGGKEASISGTGGVALLEFAKEFMNTTASNLSGLGAQQAKLKTQVKQQLNGMG